MARASVSRRKEPRERKIEGGGGRGETDLVYQSSVVAICNNNR